MFFPSFVRLLLQYIYESFFQIERLRWMDRLPQFARTAISWTADRLPYSAYGKNYLRMMLLLAPDNTILALDSETPLLIRSLIILQGYALSLSCLPVQVTTKETHFVYRRSTRLFYCAATDQHYHPP